MCLCVCSCTVCKCVLKPLSDGKSSSLVNVLRESPTISVAQVDTHQLSLLVVLSNLHASQISQHATLITHSGETNKSAHFEIIEKGRALDIFLMTCLGIEKPTNGYQSKSYSFTFSLQRHCNPLQNSEGTLSETGFFKNQNVPLSRYIHISLVYILTS